MKPRAVARAQNDQGGLISATERAIVRAPIGGCREADPNSGGSHFFCLTHPPRMSFMQHLAPPKSSPLIDRDRLIAVVDPVVRAHGAELVDFEIKNEGGWILRVYVEKLGASAERMSTKQAAVDLDLCAGIARDLSPALDVADPIPHRYSLEVSSPGIERPLRTVADFVRFAGQKAKLKLGHGVGGQKVLVGTLGPIKEGVLTIEDGSRSYAVPFDDIIAARLVFEFGPASKPKPGGSKKKRKS